jgi:Domain of unknown function (DUF1990)
MPRRPSLTRRLGTAARWPVGVGLTSWRYMWRTTPLHRSEVASFTKVLGEDGSMAVGDEYVVRMPGPWDGPVRVVDRMPTSFRFVTLAGHLEAGQIRFSAARGELLEFRIESWAQSGDRMSNLLYHHLRMSKEVQLHMWTSVLERVAELSGGRLTGGIEILTHRVDDA